MIDSESGVRFASVTAPRQLSFILQPQLCTAYFEEIRRLFRRKLNVQFDLTQVEELTLDAVVMLLGCIKNFDINAGRLIDIKQPVADVPRDFLKRYNIRKKLPNKIDGSLEPIPMQRVSNSIVANDVAKEFAKSASHHLYNTDRALKEFYEILIELMANTNNHASGTENIPTSWYAMNNFHYSPKYCEFVFLDCGIGIFESWPVKRYISGISVALQELFSVTTLRTNQLNHLFDQLAKGEIGSRTGLANRGKGLPLILKHASEPYIKEMYLITNDGYIDLKARNVSSMRENFEGTLFYLKIAVPDEVPL